MRFLFRAHDAMGHQGISKVVARIQERHTWTGIRRSVGRLRWPMPLTCQQVRNKPGDVRFHLKEHPEWVLQRISPIRSPEDLLLRQ